MTQEFNLSEKINKRYPDATSGFIWDTDVKEFIKRLKEAINAIHHDIDKQFLGKMLFKLAGYKLT